MTSRVSLPRERIQGASVSRRIGRTPTDFSSCTAHDSHFSGLADCFPNAREWLGGVQMAIEAGKEIPDRGNIRRKVRMAKDAMGGRG